MENPSTGGNPLPVPAAPSLVSDVTGLGKATERLLDHVASAIGTLYRPRAIRLEERARVDARAYEIEKTAEAVAKAATILAENEAILQRRAIERIRAVELYRQGNIDEVLQQAVELMELGGGRDAPADIHPDWMARYLDYVKDISDGEVQKIWAEILARQATDSAGKVSLMTLDSLRLLERPHAELFLEICRRVATFRTCFPFLTPQPENTQYRGVNALHALEELGFITIRTLHRPDEAELWFPFPGFGIRLTEADDYHDRFTEFTPIVEFGVTFRGEELGRIVLRETELIPYWEDYRVPDVGARTRHMTLPERTQTLRYWFTILREKGGYDVEIEVGGAEQVKATFGWNGRLVPRTEGDTSVVLPAELQPLA